MATRKTTGQLADVDADWMRLGLGYPLAVYGVDDRLVQLTKHRKVIWVSPEGDSTRGYGSESEPYATLEAAVAAMSSTRGLTVKLKPGTYTLAASVVPLAGANGGKVIGDGNVTIVTSSGKIIDVDPIAAASGAYEFTFENLKIQHTACVGLQIDNSAVAQNMTVNLKNVQFDQVTSGNSIDVDHTTASKSIALNIDNTDEEIEGAVNVVFGNAADALRIRGARLTAGLVTSADDLAIEALLKDCEVKHEGITGGHASQKLYCLNCFSKVGEVYARLDTSDTAGSHTAYVKDDSATDYGAGGLQTDLIAESTGAAGVTIDGVKLKDSVPYCDSIAEKTGAAGVTVDGVKLKDAIVYTDQIDEITGDAGVTIDGSLIKDGDIKVNTVSEKTAATGVTVDGVLLKDSVVQVDTIGEKTGDAGVTVDGIKMKDSVVYTDTVAEKTTDAGVTCDGIKMKDSVVYTDTVAEKTGGSGVTADGVLLKDYQVSTDQINELTGAAGVTIDGVKLLDSVPYCDSIAEKTGDAGVTVDGVKCKDSIVYTDQIDEKTGTAGVTIDGSLIKDGDIKVDTVTEKTGDAGVTIDGIKCKDSIVYTDTVAEKTGGAGVTCDGIQMKDSIVYTDTIAEKTGAAGVTADGVKMKDSIVYTDQIDEKSDATGVTIDGVLLKDSQVKTDTIIEKTGAAGVTADSVLLKDGSVTKTNTSAAGFVAADRIGNAAGTEGYEIKRLDYTSGVLAALNTDLPCDIPSGAVILSVMANIETAITGGGTTAKVGIGPVGDPDKYGLSADLAKNTKITGIPAHAVLGGAEDVQINGCTAAGAAGDTALTVGTIRVFIVIAVPNALIDAA